MQFLNCNNIKNKNARYKIYKKYVTKICTENHRVKYPTKPCSFFGIVYFTKFIITYFL